MGSNNQEMELKAVVEALKLAVSRRSPVDLDRFTKIVVFTDSTYIHDHVPAAIHAWSKNQWHRRSGPPVLNAQLWKELLRLLRNAPKPVHFEWLKGKSSAHSKLVDKLATASAERPYGRPPAIRSVRRKETTESVEIGSVPVQGQTLDVRIVVVERLKPQKVWKYKYEVLSGQWAGKVDVVYGDQVLLQRNSYTLRVNDDENYPQIVEVVDAWPTSSGPGAR